MANFKEKDMYPPVRDFFLDMEYEVFSEVKDCDIAMKKEDKLLIIELKRHFSIDLVLQGMDRQKICNLVYIAVPRPKQCSGQRYRLMLELVDKLDLGLVFVAMDTSQYVEVVHYPSKADKKDFTSRNKKKRQALLNEMNNRTGDYNEGGQVGTPVVTAFREQNIKIAAALFLEGPLSPKELKVRFQCFDGTGAALYKNYYGWFDRLEHGVYMLSDRGMDMIENEFLELVAYYIKEIESLL